MTDVPSNEERWRAYRKHLNEVANNDLISLSDDGFGNSYGYDTPYRREQDLLDCLNQIFLKDSLSLRKAIEDFGGAQEVFVAIATTCKDGDLPSNPFFIKGPERTYTVLQTGKWNEIISSIANNPGKHLSIVKAN